MQTKVSGIKRDVFTRWCMEKKRSTKKPLGLTARLVRDAEH